MGGAVPSPPTCSSCSKTFRTSQAKAGHDFLRHGLRRGGVVPRSAGVLAFTRQLESLRAERRELERARAEVLALVDQDERGGRGHFGEGDRPPPTYGLSSAQPAPIATLGGVPDSSAFRRRSVYS